MRLQSPYLSAGVQWLRGNLHAHTTDSDGELSPADTIAAYERFGHDFLAITDHDLLTDVAPYRANTRMVLLSGVEISAHGPHVLALDVRAIVPATRDRQYDIDAAASLGGFTVLNHPKWLHQFDHWPQEQMERLEGYAGIEIYNGVVEFLEGSALAVDRWDRLLSAGKRVWGYANDDWHAARQPVLGWNVVQATERSVAAVSDALRRGRFYASTGVTVERVVVDGATLRVETADAQCIRFVGQWGRELWRSDARAAELRVEEPPGSYVRAECYGSGMRCAWTQPVFVEE